MKTLLALLLLAVAQVAHADPADPATAVQRMGAFYSKFAYVLLADVRAEGKDLVVTPREVWKGSGLSPTATITLTTTDKWQYEGHTSPGLWVVCFDPPAPSRKWFMAGSDGVIVGAVPGLTVDGLRAYFKGLSNHSPEPTPDAVH